MHHRQHFKRSRAQATAIGAVLFFVIASIMIGFLYEVYSTQAEMNQFDAERGQERYEISDVLFGDMKTYSTPTTTITAGSGTNPFYPSHINATLTSGKMNPVPNMNFTTTSDYWSFTRSYYGDGSGSSGASGIYSTDPTGSSSGAGAVYADFRYNPPSGKYAGAYMNWTTRFYIDFTAIGGPAALASARLSWGRRVTLFDTVKGSKCPITIYLTDVNNKESLVNQEEIPREDVSWVQRSKDFKDLTGNLTSYFPASGWYKLTIVTQVELGHSGTGPPKLQVFFDDIGLILFANAYVVDWHGTFTISEAPTLVQQLDISYTGRFNETRSQNLYIMDASNNRWVLIGKSTVSTSARTFTYTFKESTAQSYISKTGEIKIRVYAVDASPFSCIADSMAVKDYFTGTTGKITLTFKNTGGVNVHIVSLWIIDSLGYNHFDLDINLSPGQTTPYTATHNWSYGKYTFKAVTDKGTITIYSTSA